MAISSTTAAQLLPSTTTTTTDYNPLMLQTLTDIINAARSQTNVPYSAYSGQQIADLSADELTANQTVRDNFLRTQGTYQAGQNLVNQGTNNLNNLMGTVS